MKSIIDKTRALTPNQKLKRDMFLKENPAIEAIYQFPQQLHELLMHRAMTSKWCRKTIPRLLEMMNPQSKALLSLWRLSLEKFSGTGKKKL